MILQTLNKREIQGRIRVFFQSQRWKNTLIFLSFVVLASSFWALQYFRQTLEFEVPIKVNYTHIPAGIVLSDNPPDKITLYVQDRGGAYLNYLFKQRKQLLSVNLNLGDISPNRTSYSIDQATLRDLISKKLSAATQLKSFSPDKIEINYSPLAQKKVPVAINGTILPAPGYLFTDSIRIEPEQIIAYGNKAALDSLRKIQTVPLDYKNIDKDWTISTDLQAPEGIHLSVNRVNLSAMVEEYTEKTFELPVVCYNLPPNRSVRFFPSTVDLIVRVGLNKYAQLLKSNFEIAVNYKDLIGKTTANCSLTLTHKPPEVKNYRIVPNMVEFLIEQKND